MNAAVERWYVVDKEGIATLCDSQAEAERSAIEHEQLFPGRAPYIVTPMRVGVTSSGNPALLAKVDALLETQGRLMFKRGNYNEAEATEFGVRLLDFMRLHGVELRQALAQQSAVLPCATNAVTGNVSPELLPAAADGAAPRQRPRHPGVASMMRRLAAWLFTFLFLRVADRREPDFIVGDDNPDGAYLLRWWLIPRNRVFNVYLHKFLRDDDDRALHDHPWCWLSFLLHGSYMEHTIAAGGIHRRQLREAGSLKASGPRRAHRIELLREIVDNGDPFVQKSDPPMPCWTIFITGPRIRRWGFHCPKGWVDFARFTKPGATGQTGAGCDG